MTLDALASAWPPAMVAFAVSVMATRRVLAYLHRRRILDMPNHRSSHTLPTPRGGGLGVMAGVIAGWTVVGAAGGLGPSLSAFAACALALMLLSWADDRRGLSPLPRFVVHAALVAAGLGLLPAEASVFQGWLPLWADRLAAGLCWLWFVNLYNFMDGIDGITGIETASVGAGLAIVSVLVGNVALAPPALALAAAGAGFLVWNWHPARVFLGDVGSVPLGYLVGGLLILLAASGELAAALILPAYYVADATITLAARALRGDRVWQAHRQHFYQRAVRGGKGHDKVALAVLAGNLALVGAAILAALGHPLAGLAAAAIVTAALLALLQRWSGGKGWE